MGEQKVIRCHDCKEYADVGKIHPSRDSEWNEDLTQTLLSFVHQHMGHQIELVGEYGGTQERWGETIQGVGGWEEVNS